VAALNVHDKESPSHDDLSHKNDILQKALERIGLSASDGGVENSGDDNVLNELFFVDFLFKQFMFISDQRNGEQDKTKERSVCTTTLVDRANPTKLV
jgi:hypothetical protein